jgi:hypothetical protein
MTADEDEKLKNAAHHGGKVERCCVATDGIIPDPSIGQA